jgi:hypothetical protein
MTIHDGQQAITTAAQVYGRKEFQEMATRFGSQRGSGRLSTRCTPISRTTGRWWYRSRLTRP